MLISGYGAGTSLAPQIRSLQDKMGDLQRQLATGKVSRDFAGLGAGRDISLTMRAQLAKSGAYNQTISFVSGRLEATQLVLKRVEGILNDTATGTLETNVQLTSEGHTVQQMLAEKRFEEMLALMDTEYEDRRLFGGRRMDAPTNAGASAIMNGKNGKDGLLEIINERQAADVAGSGPDTQGRIGIAPAVGTASDTATITDDTTPFGLKLRPGSVLTNLPNTTLNVADADTAPAAQAIGLQLTAQPADGGWVSFDVILPHTPDANGNPPAEAIRTVRLQAAAEQRTDGSILAEGDLADAAVPTTFSADNVPNSVDGFLIGADVDETAANLREAIRAALSEIATEQLPNAGAMKAAEDFFAYDDPDSATHPMRVNAAQDGWETPAAAKAKTVLWYTGEVASDRARDSAKARIDDRLEVSYGARANEALFRDTLAALAVFSSEEFPVDDHAARSRYTDLADRVRFSVASDQTEQRSRALQADFASVQVAVEEARQRHRFRDVLAEDMIDEVENVDDNLVATQLLSMQTQLQMTFQTTAMLSRMSLANVL